MAIVTKVEKRQRSFAGQLFHLLFIGFNLLMLVWLVSGFINISGMPADTGAERAGRAIGAAIGFGFILMIWIIGATLLGIFAVVTRGEKVIVEETSSPASSWFSSSETSAPTMDANAMIARYKQQQAAVSAPQPGTAQQVAPRPRFGRRGA